MNESLLRKSSSFIETVELKDSEGRIYAVEGINLKNYSKRSPKSLIFESADHSFKFEADSLQYGDWDKIYIALSMKEKLGDARFGDEMIPHNRISILKDGGDIWLDDIRFITFTRSDFSVDDISFNFEQLQQIAEEREVTIETELKEEKYKVTGVSMKKILDTFMKSKSITSLKVYTWIYDDDPKTLSGSEVDWNDVIIAWAQIGSDGKNAIPEPPNEGVIQMRVIYKNADVKWKFTDATFIKTVPADFTYDRAGMSVEDLKAKTEAVTTDAEFVCNKQSGPETKKVTGITLDKLAEHFTKGVPVEINAAASDGMTCNIKVADYGPENIMLCWSENGKAQQPIRLAVNGGAGYLWLKGVVSITSKYKVDFKVTPDKAKLKVMDEENAYAEVAPEADGSFLLERKHPYRYQAGAEGYQSAGGGIHLIPGAATVISIALSPNNPGGGGGGTPAPDPGDTGILKIFVQEGANGERKLAKNFTQQELEGMMSLNSSGYVYQYYRNGLWRGVVATAVISFDNLFSAAGVSFTSKDSMRQDAPDGFHTTLPYARIADAKYFYDPADHFNQSVVPAGIAMWWESGDIQNGHAQLAAKANEKKFATKKLRYVVGISSEAFADEKSEGRMGRRMGTGINEITIIRNEQISHSTGRVTGSSPDTAVIKPEILPGAPAPGAPKTYSDVPAGAWYAGAVKLMTEKGIMNGVSENEFAPMASLTRAQFVTILYRMKGSPQTGANPFADVAAGSYYEKAVAWAKENGIVSGYSDSQFAPDDRITREQLVTMLHRYLGSPAAGSDQLRGFNDSARVSGYAVTAMNWAVEKGVINGMGNGTVSPADNASRAQIAVMIERMAKNGMVQI